jgi:glycosyltransferase involved in cell wall biosynthesis
MKNSLPIISIIVPMYNVGKYIAQCVDSILGQTYGNLEIILINDGSPDHSGAIADEYSHKDARIKVVHIENKGVSAARNLGLQQCCGEFVAFVDGDDYLASDYVEYMYGIIKKTNSKFVMSRNCFKFPGAEKQVDVDRIETFTPEQAAAELLYPDNIDIGCWNKMFCRDFLLKNKISFPEQFYMGEGLNFIVTSAQLADCVGVGQRRVYYYRRDNENSATTALSVRKYINALDAIDHIEKTAVLDGENFRNALNAHRYFTTFAALKTILVTGEENRYQREYKSYLSFLRGNALCILKARILFLKKVRMWMYCFSPKLAHRLFSFLIA